MAHLTVVEARDAGRYNKKRARRVGWSERWSGVCHAVGVTDGNITPEAFAEQVAGWQKLRKTLKVDGKLGNDTWSVMRATVERAYKSVPRPHWLPSGPPKLSSVRVLRTKSFECPWMDIANEQRITNWREGEKNIYEADSEVDEGYFEACPYMGGRRHKAGATRNLDNNDWCAAFVNYCLHTAGYSHTGSAGAVSFTKERHWVFEALPMPKRGCVIVIRSSEGGEHVGFLDSFNADKMPINPKGNVPGRNSRDVMLLGGNQTKRGTVNVKEYTWELLSAVDTWGNRSPYLWPQQGTPNCNCDLPTARAHFCGLTWR